MPLDNNHPTVITIVENLQLKEIHETSHKLDIVDQTVKTINIEIISEDQTQIEATIQIITGIVQTQTPETDTIQMIVLETPHAIETETIQTIGTDHIKIFTDGEGNCSRNSYIYLSRKPKQNTKSHTTRYSNSITIRK